MGYLPPRGPAVTPSVASLAFTLGLAADSRRSSATPEIDPRQPRKEPKTKLMTVLFFAVAIVVGALCGALMGYETKDLTKQPGGWKPWVFLVLVAIVVACGALLVEQINTEVTLSGLTKSLSVMAAAVAFWAALVLVRRQKVKA